MKKPLLARVALLLLIGLLSFLGWAAFHAHRGLARAEQMLAHGLWDYAAVELGRYLWLHPHDDRANWLMAETLVLGGAPAVQALDYLQRIPDDSEYAASARTKQGRLELLIFHRPSRAEKLFLEAVKLDGDAGEPYYMLWKLFELTGRAHLSEPFFWPVFEQTPEGERGVRLTEWYMSQFYPLSASTELDRLLGILDPEEPATTETEAERYVHFQQQEPDGPVGYAAVAGWLTNSGDPRSAVDVLDDALTKIPADDSQHRFLVATRVEALIALGEFERAEQAMAQWPEPREGYDYWRLYGMLHDDFYRDYDKASKAYAIALAEWPGPVDWRTRMRSANTLARQGEEKKAAAAREESQRLQDLMDEKVHRPLREALTQPLTAETARRMAEFYTNVNRTKEAEMWNRFLNYLQGIENRDLESSVSNS